MPPPPPAYVGKSLNSPRNETSDQTHTCIKPRVDNNMGHRPAVKCFVHAVVQRTVPFLFEQAAEVFIGTRSMTMPHLHYHSNCICIIQQTYHLSLVQLQNQVNQK